MAVVSVYVLDLLALRNLTIGQNQWSPNPAPGQTPLQKRAPPQ